MSTQSNGNRAWQTVNGQSQRRRPSDWANTRLARGDIVMAKIPKYFGPSGRLAELGMVLGIERDVATNKNLGLWLLRISTFRNEAQGILDLPIRTSDLQKPGELKTPAMLHLQTLYLSPLNPDFENRKIGSVSHAFMAIVFDHLGQIEKDQAFSHLAHLERGASTIILAATDDNKNKALALPGAPSVRRRASDISLATTPASKARSNVQATADRLVYSTAPQPPFGQSQVLPPEPVKPAVPEPRQTADLFDAFRTAGGPVDDVLDQALRDCEAAVETEEYDEAQNYLLKSLGQHLALAASDYAALGALQQKMSESGDAAYRTETRQAAAVNFEAARYFQALAKP